MVLTYILNDFEMVPVAPISTDITLVFTLFIIIIIYYYYYYYYFCMLACEGREWSASIKDGGLALFGFDEVYFGGQPNFLDRQAFLKHQ
jgi:hypothetical protein